ncbi:hypothetical protein H0E87_025297, partial [Populus deltoides]
MSRNFTITQGFLQTYMIGTVERRYCLKETNRMIISVGPLSSDLKETMVKSA